jgi:hypothetical protein
LVLAMIVGASGSLNAQASTAFASAPPAKPWRASGTLRAEAQANSNVFLLGDDMRARLDGAAAPAAPGTRLADMASTGDYITSLQAGTRAEGGGLFGRKLAIRLDGRYDLYARNSRRNGTALDFSIAQTLPLHGRLRLRARLLPHTFSGNSMADAVDRNGDGIIQAGERVYASRTYREGRLLAGYRQPLIRSTDAHPFGLTVELEAGRAFRTYEAPFSSRDVHGPQVRAALALDLTRSLSVDLGYTHCSLNAVAAAAVLRLDEPDFRRDLNGNGTAGDLNVRSVQTVDFSRTEQVLDAAAHAGLTPRLALRTWYQRRWRRFSSTAPFDVLNNTRRDRRHVVGAQLTYRMGPHTDLTLRGDIAIQRHRESLVPATSGDFADYTRNRLSAGMGLHP